MLHRLKARIAGRGVMADGRRDVQNRPYRMRSGRSRPRVVTAWARLRCHTAQIRSVFARAFTGGTRRTGPTRWRPELTSTGRVTSLIMEHDGTVENYEPVPVPLAGKRAAVAAARTSVVRRRSARPSRRAAVYVHCLGDPFVAADIVDWYT